MPRSRPAMAPKTPVPGTPFQKHGSSHSSAPVTLLHIASPIPTGKPGSFPEELPGFWETLPHQKRGVRQNSYNRACYGPGFFSLRDKGGKMGVHVGEHLSGRAPSPEHLPGPRVHPDLHYLSRGWEGFFPAGGPAFLRLTGTRDRGPYGSFCTDRGDTTPTGSKSDLCPGLWRGWGWAGGSRKMKGEK